MGNPVSYGFRSKYTGDVWLYAHSDGYNVMKPLAIALDHAAPRWDDPFYANRMALQSFFDNASNDEFGYGVSSVIADSSHSCPIVMWDLQEVWLHNDLGGGEPKFKIGFELFIKKYGTDDLKYKYRNATTKAEATSKSLDTPEEPRYTFSEWLAKVAEGSN